VLIMLDKKEKIDSHLGLKVRKSKRQKDHEVQLVSWGKHQAQYKQQQQGGAHGPETPTTTTTYATTTANLAAPAKRGRMGSMEGAASTTAKERELSIISLFPPV